MKVIFKLPLLGCLAIALLYGLNVLITRKHLFEGQFRFTEKPLREFERQFEGQFRFTEKRQREFGHQSRSQPIFPPDPSFRPTEIGDCINNGDAQMKSLSPNCGCPPEEDSINVHRCCRRHLLKLLKDVYSEIVQADIPMVLTGGAVIGWYRNKTLIPYDFDIDASLHYEYWNTPRYLDVLKRIASRGYCVWFRAPTWTKIWSSVMAFDLTALNIVDGELYFYSTSEVHNPYKISDVLPRRLDVLEGYKVFIPNKPTNYLDHQYGKGKWRTPFKCTRRGAHRSCIE